MPVRGVYTDEEKKMLEEASELIGKEEWADVYAHPGYYHPQANRVANRDLIRRYVTLDVISDDNPLWVDEEYARNTRWGSIIAPPFFLHMIALGFGSSRALPMTPSMGRFTTLNAGSTWRFFKPVYVDDSFKVKDVIYNSIEDKTRLDGKGPRQFLVTGDRAYINQRDEVVSVVTRRVMARMWPRTEWERSGEMPTGYLTGLPKWEYSKEELEAIDRTFWEEERRGPNPRYWEDVAVGDEPKPVMHGMHTLHDQALAYAALPCHWSSRAIRRECAGNPELEALAKDACFRGIQGTIEATTGAQHDSMMGHLLTNWMGDDGFLKRFDFRDRTMNPSGDANWVRGKVVRKYVENGEHLVDLAVWIDSIRGWIVAHATATVVLPSRTTFYRSAII